MAIKCMRDVSTCIQPATDATVLCKNWHNTFMTMNLILFSCHGHPDILDRWRYWSATSRVALRKSPVVWLNVTSPCGCD